MVLCLQSPLRVEKLHLGLVGTLRYSWTDPGLLGNKSILFNHQWSPFVGTHGTSMVLSAGNYEWPFECVLPGDLTESVEGISEASVQYKLTATISRSKLTRDLHTSKALRVIRTPSPEELETMAGVSIDNTWLDKIDYSISIPTKAAPFGGFITLKMLFTPLIKGLKLGEITVLLVETRDCFVQGSNTTHVKEHHTEREVSRWRFKVTMEDWHNTLEDTAQEGWALKKKLDLPNKIRQCVQTLNHSGIKIDHKIKVRVPLCNPDGHISELLTILPIMIFISPNMRLDVNGNMEDRLPVMSNPETATTGPPEYGAHVLDQLYDTSEVFQGARAQSEPVTRAQTPDQADSMRAGSSQASAFTTQRSSLDNAAHNAVENMEMDSREFHDLTRVPTYRTAVRTPFRSHAQFNDDTLPDYHTAAETSSV